MAASPVTPDRQPGPAGLGQHGCYLVRGQGREQHLALRGLRRREVSADFHPQRDQLGHRDAGHVDDVGPVELGHGRRLAGAGHQRFHVRPGDIPQAQRAHVRHAQAHHLRGQPEGPAGGPDEAQLLQGQQQAAGGGPGQPGRGRHLAERHAAVVYAERGQDVQPARQRLDEVRPLTAPGHPLP